MKLTISPGQALLILIAAETEPSRKALLKCYYLSGAGRHTEALMHLLQTHEALADYHVSSDYDVINEDASRRYFETHLAHETLVSQLSTLDESELMAHINTLKQKLPAINRAHFEAIAKGHLPDVLQQDATSKTYASRIQMINENKLFQDFSAEEKGKIKLLLLSALLGIMHSSQHPEDLPIPVDDIPNFSDQNRGRALKTDQDRVQSQNTGLLKSYMATPAYDDVARAESAEPKLRAADQANYMKHIQVTEGESVENEQIRMFFSQLTHPFSNAISGTMLCQLRMYQWLQSTDEGVFTTSDAIEKVSKLMSTALLFAGGGHSLFEFFSPFYLPIVKTAFKDTPGFEAVTLEHAFLTDNQPAFDTALEKATQYNQMLLYKQSLQQSIMQAKEKLQQGEIVHEQAPNTQVLLDAVATARKALDEKPKRPVNKSIAQRKKETEEKSKIRAGLKAIEAEVKPEQPLNIEQVKHILDGLSQIKTKALSGIVATLQKVTTTLASAEQDERASPKP